MRFLGDRLQFFELHRTVNLHLLEARIVIFVGPHARLFGRVHASDAKSQWPGAVHDSSEQQARTEATALRNSVAHSSDKFEFIAAIANGCGARSEVDWPPFDLLKMRVHVPKPGEDRFAARVNFGSAFRNLHLFARPGSDDLSLFDHHD